MFSYHALVITSEYCPSYDNLVNKSTNKTCTLRLPTNKWIRTLIDIICA